MTLNPFRIGRALRAHFSGPRDRGAALVEAAIAIPLLLMVIMGSVEFGFGWEAKSTSTSGVRSGILRAATLGDRPETDLSILQSIIGEVGPENVDRIEWVAIFKADVVDKQARIDACVATGSDCVLYDNRTSADGGNGFQFLNEVLSTASADVDTFRATHFDPGGTRNGLDEYQCATGKADTNWCAGKRSDYGNDVELGIAISYKHEWFTGILPFDPPTFTDFTVTSTFINEGRDISPTNVVIPDKAGAVYDGDFNGSIPAGLTSAGPQPLVVQDIGNDADGNDIEVLGRFGSQSINLTVPTPQSHTQVCVSFNLWVIGSWDGGDPANPGRWGPDTFSVDIAGTTAADTGDEHNEVYVEASSGNDTLEVPGTRAYGRKVPISVCQEHSGDSVSIDFAANMIQNNAATTSINDESWAIDDLVVTVNNN